MMIQVLVSQEKNKSVTLRAPVEIFVKALEPEYSPEELEDLFLSKEILFGSTLVKAI